MKKNKSKREKEKKEKQSGKKCLKLLRSEQQHGHRE